MVRRRAISPLFRLGHGNPVETARDAVRQIWVRNVVALVDVVLNQGPENKKVKKDEDPTKDPTRTNNRLKRSFKVDEDA
jgi:hypothetical protein